MHLNAVQTTSQTMRPSQVHFSRTKVKYSTFLKRFQARVPYTQSANMHASNRQQKQMQTLVDWGASEREIKYIFYKIAFIDKYGHCVCVRLRSGSYNALFFS